MHFALMLMLALAQAQYGKDTKGAEATTHDKQGVAEPDGRGKDNPPPATASDTSDKAQSLSPVDRTELQGQPPKKSAAKSTKKAHKSAKSMPQATPPSTPGNAMERDDTATPGKKTPAKHKEPNMNNEDQNPDNKSPNGQH
jgi:hypothetical protein